MPQHIGNAGTKATAWTEYIVSSPHPQVKKAKELGEFTRRLRPLFEPGKPLAAPLRGHSDTEMVLLASAKSAPSTASTQHREAQAQANEQLAARALAENDDESPSGINPEEVANKVYRLMQRDLVLERERATKLGG